MINKDRIVPVTKTDLLSLYVTVLRAMGETVNVIEAQDGIAQIAEGATGRFIVNEPIKAFAGELGEALVFFCPAYDFSMTATPQNGAAEFEANPGDLYLATGGQMVQLSTGAIYTLG